MALKEMSMIWILLYPLMIVAFVTKKRWLKKVGFIGGAIGSVLAVVAAGEGAGIALIAVAFVWLITWIIAQFILFVKNWISHKRNS